MVVSALASITHRESSSADNKPRRFTMLFKALRRTSGSRVSQELSEKTQIALTPVTSQSDTVQQTRESQQSPRPMVSNTQQDLTKAYLLKRDYMGSSRLNLQYYLWKESLGFNIHPNIPVASLDPTARIADVATGTGIWLMESRSLFPPTAKLDALDVDLSCAPHPKWLPSNMSLRQWDMLSDVPEDLVGTYDFVHVRLILLVIKDSNPTKLINNLFKLLKPGGYLQWDELDVDNKKIVKVNDAVRADGINAMFRVDLPKGAKGSDDWQTHLPATLKSHGFAEATRYDYEPSPTTARYWHDM